MHATDHALLEAVAAAILVGGGGILMALAWRARLKGGSATPVSEPLTSVPNAARAVVAAASLGAATIHLAAAPVHLDVATWLGVGFIAVGAVQAAWALAWLIESAPGVVRLGVAINVAVVAVWAWSRTIGLPLGAGSPQPEPVGAADVVAVGCEVLVVGILAARGRPATARLASWIGGRGLATIIMVPLIGLILVATTVALGALTDGHDHGPADSGSGAMPSAEVRQRP